MFAISKTMHIGISVWLANCAFKMENHRFKNDFYFTAVH